MSDASLPADGPWHRLKVHSHVHIRRQRAADHTYMQMICKYGGRSRDRRCWLSAEVCFRNCRNWSHRHSDQDAKELFTVPVLDDASQWPRRYWVHLVNNCRRKVRTIHNAYIRAAKNLGFKNKVSRFLGVFGIRRPNTKVRPKSTRETSHTWKTTSKLKNKDEIDESHKSNHN